MVVFILVGASTFQVVVSYFVLTRGSNEQRELLLRAKAIDCFMHKIEVFQSEHGHDVGREWDEKVNGFRLDLENILRNQPRSSTINSLAAITHSGPEEGASSTDTGLGQ